MWSLSYRQIIFHMWNIIWLLSFRKGKHGCMTNVHMSKYLVYPSWLSAWVLFNYRQSWMSYESLFAQFYPILLPITFPTSKRPNLVIFTARGSKSSWAQMFRNALTMLCWRKCCGHNNCEKPFNTGRLANVHRVHPGSCDCYWPPLIECLMIWPLMWCVMLFAMRDSP